MQKRYSNWKDGTIFALKRIYQTEQTVNNLYGKKQKTIERSFIESRKLYPSEGPQSAYLRVLAEFRLEENVHS